MRAVGEVELDGARGLEREPGLADTAGPGQGQQANRARPQALGDRADLTRAADRAVRRRRQRAAALGRGSHRHVLSTQRRCRVGVALARQLHCRRRQVERRVLAQDRLVHALQLSAGLDAGVLDEDLAGVAVDLERLGLPSAAIQREHQLHRRAARASDARPAAG